MALPLRFLVAVLFAVALSAAPARAETRVSLGAGVGYLLSDEAPSQGSLGIALEALAEHRISEGLSLRVRMDWGLTHFDRTAAAVRFANSVGSWTAGAYGSVTDWIGEGDPQYTLFKLMGAVFAYAFLAFGFVFAGVVYAISPLLATSFLELGVTTAGHLSFGPGDVYIEGGVGGLVYVDSKRGELVPGTGPLVGVGFRYEKLRFGVHVLWAPPALQLRADNGPHVYAGGLTFGADM